MQHYRRVNMTSIYELTCEETIRVISLMASGYLTLIAAMEFIRDTLTIKAYTVFGKVNRKTSN